MADRLLGRVLNWLRAGYPNGVPQGDYVALLGLLHRQLTATELRDIVEALAAMADESQEPIGREDIEQMVRDKAFQRASEQDIARVAARLASGGWPLAPSEALLAESDDSDTEGLLARVVAWLKKGYPTGVPQQDYVPIIAILRRRLTDDEVSQVAELLSDDETMPLDRAAIGAAIVKVKDEMPTEADFARVHAHLDESELDAPR